MADVVLDPDLLHVRIPHFARASLWPWWRLNVISKTWVIYANDRDGARVTASGHTYPLRAGRVLVLPPEHPFRTDPGRDPAVHQLFLHIELLGLSAEATALLAPRPVELGDEPILAAQAAALHHALGDILAGQPAGESQPELALAARAFVFQALARLVSLLPSARQLALRDQVQRDGDLAPALRHIEHHLHEPLYVGPLAALCGMGAQWFTRRFRAATGRTPARWINDRRVAAAAQRLAFTDDPIEAIADALAFTDRAHFTRVFTHARGVAPARFRAEERLRLSRGQPSAPTSAKV